MRVRKKKENFNPSKTMEDFNKNKNEKGIIIKEI